MRLYSSRPGFTLRSRWAVAWIALAVVGGIGLVLLGTLVLQRSRDRASSPLTQAPLPDRPAADGAFESWHPASVAAQQEQAPARVAVKPRPSKQVALASFSALAAGPASLPESDRDLASPSPAGLATSAPRGCGIALDGDGTGTHRENRQCGRGASGPGTCVPPVSIGVPKDRPYGARPRTACGGRSGRGSIGGSTPDPAWLVGRPLGCQ